MDEMWLVMCLIVGLGDEYMEVHCIFLYNSEYVWENFHNQTLNIISQLSQQLAFYKVELSTEPIIHSCMSSSPLNQALLLSALLLKGIAATDNGGYSWCLCCQVTPSVFWWHDPFTHEPTCRSGHSVLLTGTDSAARLGVTPAPVTYQLYSLDKPLNLSVPQLHCSRSRTSIVPSS